MLGFAMGAAHPRWEFHKIRSSVHVKKTGLLTQKIYMQYIGKLTWKPCLKFVCIKLQRKHRYGPFLSKYFSGM